MMSLISPRHGAHQEAQKLRSTGRPLHWERVVVPPASVFSVKSGAGDPSVWADSSPATVRSVANAIEKSCKPSRTLVPQGKTPSSRVGSSASAALPRTRLLEHRARALARQDDVVHRVAR